MAVSSWKVFFYFSFSSITLTPLHSFPFTSLQSPYSFSHLHLGTSIHVAFFFKKILFCLLFFPSFYPTPPLKMPPPLLPFRLHLPSLDILCKELSGFLDLTRSSLTKRLRKTRYYVLSYTFCNRPSNLVTTVQFKPGLKATKIAPNAN